ncbi:MAG: agmatinase, partial [Eubacteriales bacterium]
MNRSSVNSQPLLPNIDTFIGCGASYEESETVLFGAPFDSTTSFRPGTRFAPRSIRGDSWGLETYSPYQDKDLEDRKIFDSGDLELCFGDTNLALGAIEGRAEKIIADGKRPFMIGGEHLVTLGAVRAALRHYPELRIIHLDAHTDLREAYLGATLSHATVIRRCHDITGDGRIWQFGIRSGEKNEFQFAEKHNHLTKFNLDGFDDMVAALKGYPVYFTLDLDILDPSVMPGTGTPEAGGVTFAELLAAILKLSALNIVAADVVELSPPYDASGSSTAVACKLIRELLLVIGER